jgi:hypothetical protein
LNFKNQKEWLNYCKSELKPDFIPGSPDNTYKEEWLGLGDWLGTFTVHGRDMHFLSFEEARLFVQKLNLKSVKEWTNYWVFNKRPNNIPYRPDGTYKNNGWIDWADWLGTNNIAHNKKVFISFLEAREIVHKLKLSTNKEFKLWNKANPLILIPANPDNIYKNKGWISWSDWLGSNKNRNYLSYEEARKFARSLKLNNQKEWNQYCKINQIPLNIPTSNPQWPYKNEWIGWPDWLGTDFVANKYREFLSFEEAREFARSLKLKNQIEWFEHSKSKQIPLNIPSNPQRKYKDKWIGWPDWLGTN